MFQTRITWTVLNRMLICISVLKEINSNYQLCLSVSRAIVSRGFTVDPSLSIGATNIVADKLLYAYAIDSVSDVLVCLLKLNVKFLIIIIFIDSLYCFDFCPLNVCTWNPPFSSWEETQGELQTNLGQHVFPTIFLQAWRSRASAIARPKSFISPLPTFQPGTPRPLLNCRFCKFSIHSSLSTLFIFKINDDYNTI